MSRPFALLLVLPAIACCAILPDTIGDWKRGDVSPLTVAAANAKIWAEYGLQESESAPFSGPAGKCSIDAYRFTDSTGAYAAWLSIRPAGAVAIEGDGKGVEFGNDRFIAVGNLLLVFHGFKPDHDQLAHLYLTAPHYSGRPLPTLPGYFPAGAAGNSERYILGPESLAKYAGEIPPSTAAFHYSSEAEAVDYPAPAGAKKSGKTTLVIFNFPAIEMAQKQLAAFESVPGAVAKRSGPLVAIALHSPTPDEAERLLAPVKYQAEVTMSEKPPSLKDNPGNLLLNVAILCGVLIVLCLAGGLLFGGMRYVLKKSGKGVDGEEMISLHLTDRG